MKHLHMQNLNRFLRMRYNLPVFSAQFQIYEVQH
jgi:glutaredoxin-related protein